MSCQYLQGVYPILTRKTLAREVYDYTVHCPEMAAVSVAGQFVHIRVAGHTLRRPISICQVDRERGTLRLVFETKGSGTVELAKLAPGELMDLMGPLGNGFALLSPEKKAIVVGGGIGTPPMLETARHYGKNATAICGFRSAAQVILEEDFAAAGCRVCLATDDGSKGQKGFVTDLLRERLGEEKADIIYACGPTPMLEAVAKVAAQFGVRCQVSLEERMGCGVGACLVCACKIARENGDPTYKHVCKDGPVFEAEEVIFHG